MRISNFFQKNSTEISALHSVCVGGADILLHISTAQRQVITETSKKSHPICTCRECFVCTLYTYLRYVFWFKYEFKTSTVILVYGRLPYVYTYICTYTVSRLGFAGIEFRIVETTPSQ